MGPIFNNIKFEIVRFCRKIIDETTLKSSAYEELLILDPDLLAQIEVLEVCSMGIRIWSTLEMQGKTSTGGPKM